MNISQLQEVTKKGGTRKFKVVGPMGERTGAWLDPWLGFLQIDGMDGLMRAKDFLFQDDLIWLQIEEE